MLLRVFTITKSVFIMDSTYTSIIRMRTMLKDAFLELIQLQLYPKREGTYQEICFPLRWHPQNNEESHTFIEKAMGKQLNLNVEDKNFSLGIDTVVSRVAYKIRDKFNEEMTADGFFVEETNQKGQPKDKSKTPYGVTYRWLWEKKFPRMAWDIAKEVAVPTDKMEMIPYDEEIPDPEERVAIEHIPKEETLEMGKKYRLKLNLRDKGYLILITEDAKEKKFLISPSTAYAEIPFCSLTQPLYLPPNDDSKYRAPLKFDTEEELFIAIVTNEEVELSCITNKKYRNENIPLPDKDLLKIFEKVIKIPDCEVYKRSFFINAMAD